MFKLEHGEKDQGLGKKMIPVLGKLVNRNESAWKDDFAANSALRASFRVSSILSVSKSLHGLMWYV